MPLTEGRRKNKVVKPAALVKSSKISVQKMNADAAFNTWWETQPLSRQNVPVVMTMALKEVAYRGWMGAYEHVSKTGLDWFRP